MKMKSPSSSSSSPLSFSSKTHSFGCISLILQRFLCSGTSSTYPSDQIDEPSFESPDFSSEPPGAVARLMGLDSIPLTDKTRVLSRSRSVNNLKKDNDEIQGIHRRVKSTLDSHQIPEYIELEDDKFFILSFEKDKNDKGFGELKQMGTRKCNKRRDKEETQTRIEEDKENNINSANTWPGYERHESEELKRRKKEKRKNRRKRREIKLRQNIKSYGWSRNGDLANCEVRSTKEEEDCGSCDDWSPVSVLDYIRVTQEPENSSRRRLSSELESSKPNEAIQEDHITLTNSRSRDSNLQHHVYQEMWLMICRLNVSEIKGSNWNYGKASKHEDLEGIISDDIVSRILDQLLEETIVTLSLTSQV